MNLEALVDNDILLKFANYNLLPYLFHLNCDVSCDKKLGVLGAARFVLGTRLARLAAQGNGAGLAERWTSFMDSGLVDELNPDPEELALAAQIEDIARTFDLQLDAGESQLFAIACLRAGPMVLTGDKRAIAALEFILGQDQPLSALEGKVVCLEQTVMTLLRRLTGSELRQHICGAREVDKALSVCFSCSNPDVVAEFYPRGLRSYIRHLRSTAPRALIAGTKVRY